MAKSSRSSAKKANNQRKAANIFGPAETARAERLSAKLLELAKQPAESRDVNMETLDEQADSKDQATSLDDAAMDVDSSKSTRTGTGKNRIAKRKHKKSSHVFTKYSERKAAMKKKSTKSTK